MFLRMIFEHSLGLGEKLRTLVQGLTVCNDFALFDCTADITGTGYRSGYIVESD